MPRGMGAARPDDRLEAIGLAIGGFGPLAIAALLVPLRHELVGVHVALVFVVVVVLAAACGGRVSGVVAAVVSTMSYDFFFTKPYQSLKIDRAEDIGTAVLLLGIGLIVAEVMAFGYRSRQGWKRTREEVTRLHRVAELVAGGVVAEDVLLSVRAELLGLLSLRECEFEQPPFESALPRVERNGAIEGGTRRWVGREFSLPAEGVEIPVLGRGRVFGRLVLIPDWNVGTSVEERVVAVALADQVGAAFAAEPWPYRTTERNVL
jgi:Domain of unknown function (DUF4118)